MRPALRCGPASGCSNHCVLPRKTKYSKSSSEIIAGNLLLRQNISAAYRKTSTRARPMRASSWIILPVFMMLADAMLVSSAGAAENDGGNAGGAPRSQHDKLSADLDRLVEDLRVKSALRQKREAGPEPRSPVETDAASTHQPLPQNDATPDYRSVVQKRLDDDERSWKRLTNSICAGCGTAHQPVKAPPVNPGEVLARHSLPSGDLEAKASETAKNTSPVRVAAAPRKRLRYAKLRRQLLSQTRRAAHIRQRSRTASLHPAWSDRHVARARVRFAGQALRMYRAHWQTRKVVAIRRRFVALGSKWVRARNPGHSPHRNRQRYALCTYSYGAYFPAALWPIACVSSQ